MALNKETTSYMSFALHNVITDPQEIKRTQEEARLRTQKQIDDKIAFLKSGSCHDVPHQFLSNPSALKQYAIECIRRENRPQQKILIR